MNFKFFFIILSIFFILSGCQTIKEKSDSIAEKENKKGFIPCLPSSIILDYDYTWMDDNIWDNFKDTINFLNFVYEDNNSNCITIIIYNLFFYSVIISY